MYEQLKSELGDIIEKAYVAALSVSNKFNTSCMNM